MTNIETKMPEGYTLLSKIHFRKQVYSYLTPAGFVDKWWLNQTWWDSKTEAIDAAWKHVRDTATAVAAKPDKLAGGLSGAEVDELARLIMRRAGYEFDPETTAEQIIEKLLVMLNGAR